MAEAGAPADAAGHAGPADPEPGASSDEGRPRRGRLALHAAALLFALTLILTLGGRLSSVSSDEGAAIHQARLLQRGGWLMAPTLPELDPDLVRQPFLRADVGPKGRAPYAKHPAYPLLLEKAGQAWWPWGLVVPGVLGTWIAALAAALLAGGLRRRATLPTLWLVGLGSPLTVDAHMVLAHAPGAATAGVAALATATVVAPEAFGPRVSKPWMPIAATLTAAIAAAATVALRTEGILLVAGLALGALVAGSSWRRALPLAAALVAGGAAARALEVAGTRSIVGAGSAAPGSPSAGSSFASGRLQAFRSSWLDVGFDHGGGVLLAVGIAALVLAVAGARGRARPGVVMGLLAIALGGTAMWLLLGSIELVPGLLPATPWLAAGLAAVGGSARRRGLPRFLAVAVTTAAGGILATQYSFGGGVEWGGRFYAIVLPLAAPVVVVALWPDARRWWRSPRGPILITVVVVTSMVSLGGLLAVRSNRAETASLARTIANAAADAPPGRPGDPDERAVVVGPQRLWPQLLWPELDEYRWVTTNHDGLPCAFHDLHAAGFQRLVLLGPFADDVVALAEPQGWRLVPGTARGFTRVVEAGAGRPETAPSCPAGLLG